MLPGEKQYNRIRQRAFRDFLKDIIPVANDFCPIVRIPFQLVNKKSGFNQSELQRIVDYIIKNDDFALNNYQIKIKCIFYICC